MYRTQKANGLEYLRRHWRYGAVRHYSVFPYGDLAGLEFPIFARPCPVRPRHGFLDSRVIYNLDELARLIVETLRLDPEGEVILMPVLTARYSGILTHAGLAVGLGNDAVTGGKHALTVPAYASSSSFKDAAGITTKLKDAAYIEFVEDKGELTVVQMRDGPVTPATQDYIPVQTKVTVISRPLDENFDLLEWETEVTKFEQGTVVVIPRSSLSSHYAVHAILHNIPVITSRSDIEIGDVLDPPEEGVPEEPDYQEIADYLIPLMKNGLPPVNFQTLAKTAIGVLHTQMGWGNKPHLNRLRAWGVLGMVNLNAIASIAEDRHYFRSVGPSGNSNLPTKFQQQIIGQERNAVYCENITLPMEELMEATMGCAVDFGESGWGGGYGGSKWQTSAIACVETMEAVKAFSLAPCKKTWIEVVMRYNALVNMCHNNGKILNKWLSGSHFDLGEEAPGLLLFNQLVAEVALDLPITKEVYNEHYQIADPDDEEEEESSSWDDEPCYCASCLKQAADTIAQAASWNTLDGKDGGVGVAAE